MLSGCANLAGDGTTFYAKFPHALQNFPTPYENFPTPYATKIAEIDQRHLQ